jgi:hypothetical protein
VCSPSVESEGSAGEAPSVQFDEHDVCDVPELDVSAAGGLSKQRFLEAYLSLRRPVMLRHAFAASANATLQGLREVSARRTTRRPPCDEHVNATRAV